MEIHLDPGLKLVRPYLFNPHRGYVRDGEEYPRLRVHDELLAHDGRSKWVKRSMVYDGPQAGTPVVTCSIGQRGWSYGSWGHWIVAEDGTLTAIPQHEMADMLDPDPDMVEQRRLRREYVSTLTDLQLRSGRY